MMCGLGSVYRRCLSLFFQNDLQSSKLTGSLLLHNVSWCNFNMACRFHRIFTPIPYNTMEKETFIYDGHTDSNLRFLTVQWNSSSVKTEIFGSLDTVVIKTERIWRQSIVIESFQILFLQYVLIQTNMLEHKEGGGSTHADHFSLWFQMIAVCLSSYYAFIVVL